MRQNKGLLLPGYLLAAAVITIVILVAQVSAQGQLTTTGDTVDLTAPAEPAGLTARDARTGGQVELQWTANNEDDLAGYLLYRGEAAAGPYQQVGPEMIMAAGYSDTGLTDGVQYFYQLVAADDVGNSSPATEAVSTTPTHDTIPPTIPGEFTVDNPGTGTELLLSWQASPEADTAGYLLYRVAQAGDEPALLTRIADGQVIDYSDRSVERNQSYWYQIASYDDRDNTSAVSAVVAAVALDISAPAEPAGLTDRDARTGGQVELQWTANNEDDLAGYLLYRAEAAAGPYQQAGQPPAAASSYRDTGLIDGLTYSYQLSAVDSSGNQSRLAAAVTVTASLDATPPAQPTGLAARDPRTGGALELSWAGNSEADLAGYLLYRAEAAAGPYQQVLQGMLFTTEYSDTGVTNDVTYYYQLAAVDDLGNVSLLSMVVSAVPTHDTEPPQVPTGLVARDTGSGGTVILNWRPNQEGDLAGYLLYRAEAAAGPYQQVARLPAAASSYWDTGLSDGLTYSYQLSAVDSSGNQSSPAAAVAVTPSQDSSPPATPAGLAVRDPRTGGVLELSWTGNSEDDLAGYLLYRAEHEEGPFLKLAQGIITSANYNDTGVRNDQIYYYQLAAVDRVGNASPFTGIVRAVPTHDTTPPAIPAAFQVTNPGTGTELLLSWQTSPEPDAAGYLLYRRDQEEGAFKLLARITAIQETVYTDQDVVRNQRYWYQLAAYDDLGNTTEDLEAVAAAALDTIPPALPTGLIVQDQWNGIELLLNWETNNETDLAGYNLYRGQAGDQLEFVMLNQALLAGTAYIDTGLTQGALYYYRLTAVDTSGNETGALSSAACQPLQGAAVNVANPDGVAPHHLRVELSNSAMLRNTNADRIVITVIAEDALGQPVAVSGVWKLATDLGTISELELVTAAAARGVLKSTRLGSAEITVWFVPDQAGAAPLQAGASVRVLEWYVDLTLDEASALTGEQVALWATVTDREGVPVTDPGAQVYFVVSQGAGPIRNQQREHLVGRYQGNGRAFPVNPMGIPIGVGGPDRQGQVAGRLQAATMPGVNRVAAVLQFRDLQVPGGLLLVDTSAYRDVAVAPGPARYVGWQPDVITVKPGQEYRATINAYDAYGNITGATGNLEVSIQSPLGGHVDFSLDGGRTWVTNFQWYPVDLGAEVRFRVPGKPGVVREGSYAYLLVRIDHGSGRLSPPPGINQANKPLIIRVHNTPSDKH